VTFNDDAAVSVMGQLSQAGIDVPKQLSMVGWDDSVTATHAPVPLTTVAQQPAELARLALERIVTRLGRRRVESHQIVLEPELKVRSSTAAINLNTMS
jgi:DNA-binding LacI/PurR family transcriptional regulator